MISIELRREELLAHDPCEDGLAIFDAIAELQGDPNRIVVPEWGPLNAAWLFVAHPAFTCWLQERAIIPVVWPYLAGADLARANLAGANLAGADLAGAYRGTYSPKVPGWRTLATGYLERETEAEAAQ